MVELVHPDDEVFRKDVLGRHHLDAFIVARVDLERVVRVDTHQTVLAMIEVVGTLAQVEIEDADGIDLLHVEVSLAERHVLRDGLGHPIEHTLEEIQLARLLDLHQDDFALAVARLDVDAVELVALVLLVALALKDFHNLDFLANEHSH